MSGPPAPGPALFERFTQAQTCKETRVSFVQLCRHLQLDPGEHQQLFYSRLQERLNHWKAKELWQKINTRAAHPLYQRGGACRHNQVLVVGAGPCGLRVAVELALLGARVLLLDKRSSFNRNNVLHLWPYTIRDLRSLGAKHFYGRFCSGALDHISIRQLQLILLKLALVLGVELHTGVTYHALLEPTGNTGWRAEVSPKSHEVASFQFDVFISAAGGRFVPEGFRIKELRGKLAIGITANFVNRRTKEEAQVQEISGVARIYNQKFFQELQSQKGVDLENIVYYRDDTHYFVMTAKKASLLKRGVIKQDFSDAVQLLSPANVDPEALMHYAYDAADFSTQEMLPDLEFARNHAAQPDVAMFDFTSMHRAENASLVRERSGKKLLIGLVGDALVEPFWPLGTGIARGFFGAFDAAWMVRRWGMGVAPLELLAERESVYQLLSQTTPENTSKNYAAYSIDPATRYPNLNPSSIKPRQVQRLYSTCEGVSSLKKPVLKAKPRSDSVRRAEELLSWCQRSTRGYEGVSVTDLSDSWRCGRALCALIHHFRPALIDPAALDLSDPTRNHQLAFDLMEKEFGITPVTRASDMSRVDQLTMMIYLTQIRQALAQTHQPTGGSEQSRSLSRTRSAVVFINQLNHHTLQRRKERQATLKRPRTRAMEEQEEEEKKEEEVKEKSSVSAPPPQAPPSDSERCCFCQERLYVLERESAEGKFFHRSCFTCHCCRATLRHGGYSYHTHTGRFYCELHSETEEEDDEGHRMMKMAAEGGAEGGADTQGGSPAPHASVRRKSSYKISVDPECVELLPEDPPTPVPVPAPSPVPAPRGSRCRADDPPPLPKPRTVHNVTEPRPEVATPCRYLLQLSEEEEKSEDSDSDTPLSRYWTGARSLRDQRNRRCQNRRSESLQDNARVRSKFSPWNLSSPRPQPRPAPTGHQRSEDEEEEEEDTGDHFLDCGEAEFVLSESEKAELTRMKTLERKAKMREFNRFHKAQAIQRRLDEIEVTFKDLEEKGVELERELRADAGSGDPETIDRWIGLVHQKNALLSEESDLMVASRQLELEDKQSMLEMELRRYMEMDDAEKSPAQREHEQQVLQEKLDVVDMRDSLVAFLEEKRLKEISEVWG